MKKAIRVLSIVSTALVGLSLVLMLFSILLQPFLANPMHSSVFARQMIIPIVPLMTVLLTLGCTLFPLFFAGKENRGIWSEILVIALLATAIPLIHSVASLVFQQLINAMGSEYIAAYVSVLSITNLFKSLADLGVVLAYVVCGMSIAYKKSSQEPRRIYVQ